MSEWLVVYKRTPWLCRRFSVPYFSLHIGNLVNLKYQWRRLHFTYFLQNERIPNLMEHHYHLRRIPAVCVLYIFTCIICVSRFGPKLILVHYFEDVNDNPSALVWEDFLRSKFRSDSYHNSNHHCTGPGSPHLSRWKIITALLRTDICRFISVLSSKQ